MLRAIVSVGRAGPVEHLFVGEREAAVRVPGAILLLDRVRATITVHCAREPEQAALVHPYLWPAAAIFARWRGAETLHAGAFRLPGRDRAWVVIGASGSGKSSLLAALALAGCEVLADDLVVVEGSDCYAGPRCIDLKPDAVSTLPAGPELVSVRASERRRLVLAPCDGVMPIHGFVHLLWDDEVSVATQLPSRRFATLVDHRRVAALGADYAQLLDLAGLPMLCVRRPAARPALNQAAEVLLEALAGRQ